MIAFVAPADAAEPSDTEVFLVLGGAIIVTVLIYRVAGWSAKRDLARMGIVVPPRTRRERWRDAMSSGGRPHVHTDRSRRGLRGYARWMGGGPGAGWRALSVAALVLAGVARGDANGTLITLAVTFAILIPATFAYWRVTGWHRLWWWEDQSAAQPDPEESAEARLT